MFEAFHPHVDGPSGTTAGSSMVDVVAQHTSGYAPFLPGDHICSLLSVLTTLLHLLFAVRALISHV